MKSKSISSGEVIKLKSGEYIFKLGSHSANPIVRPADIGLVWYENRHKKIGAVFNPGAGVYNKKVILLPRCHKGYRRGVFYDPRLKRRRYYLDNYISEIWPLISNNRKDFKRLDNIVIKGDGTFHQDFIYGIEDVRIVKYQRLYILVGCGKVRPPFVGRNADRIAIYSTRDFKCIEYNGMVNEFDTRNVVPYFSDKKSYLFLRFHPHIHLTLLSGGVDQLLRPERYKRYWREIYNNRRKSLLFSAGQFLHEKEKIGPSTQIIKTRKGLLFIYHGVGEIDVEVARAYGLKRGIRRGYSISAALLATENPRRVIARTRRPIYIPSRIYELRGNRRYPVDVPYVVFPVGAIKQDNNLLVYCGAGDKYIILLTCELDYLISYLLRYCQR